MNLRAKAAPTQDAAPLAALHAVVLDTETTGLDVREARLVQIGALRMTGEEPRAEERFDCLVNPGVPIPPESTRIHHIADADVAGAPATGSAVTGLAEYCGDAVIVGHNIHFDLAILRREAARAGLRWPEPRALDIGLLAAGLEPGRIDVSLDALASSFGVEIHGRHSAFGDAEATARIFGAMIPLLRAKGVRTLAQAEALMNRQEALLARRAEAGWLDRPGDAPDFAGAEIRSGAARAIDGFLYRHQVGEVMGAPALSIAPDASVWQAAAKMQAHGVGCLIVAPLPEGVSGIVTERDILTVTAAAGSEAAARDVAAIMTAPVISTPRDAPLYRVLGQMARRNLRYIAVTDADGSICGVFTLRTLLRQRALATLTVGDELAEAESARGLARAQGALPGLAASLRADGMSARDVAKVISAEGRAITARAAELALVEMEEEGHGPAPAPWRLLVLGSGGRGESLLAPDQDNALVIDDGYSGDIDAPDDWFARWAGKLNVLLDVGGVPFCPGGVMARERPWRRTLSEWRAQIEGWARHPDPQALLNADIFFDFAPAAESCARGAALGEALRQTAAEIAAGAGALTRALAEQASGRKAALGLFGRFRRDAAGRVDLKAGGMLPIVSAARALALRWSVPARATPERLLGAAEAAGIGATDARILADAQGFLMTLILDQQLRDIAAGAQPSSRVDVAAMARDEAEHLREAMKRAENCVHFAHDVLAAAPPK